MHATPPPPSSTSLLEWFAGIALANPELMKGVAPEDQVRLAAKIASDMVNALAAPRSPSKESIPVPTPEALARAEQRIVNLAEKQRETLPAIKAARHAGPAAAVTQDALESSRETGVEASTIAPDRHRDSPGAYSFVTPKPEQP